MANDTRERIAKLEVTQESHEKRIEDIEDSKSAITGWLFKGSLGLVGSIIIMFWDKLVIFIGAKP